MEIVGARDGRPTSATSVGHARVMIGARYCLRLLSQYAGKKSGKHRLHHLVAHHLRVAHSEELHAIAQAHQAEREGVCLQGQWPAVALREHADVRADPLKLFMPEGVKALLKPGVSACE